jgi:hypothetical protein
MNRNLAILLIALSLAAGITGGYTIASKTNNTREITEVDLQIRSFAASYGLLRNIIEKSNDDGARLMYTMMNNSIEKLYSLYPTASAHHKEMIYISLKGYSDYIMTNELYSDNDIDINDLVIDLIQKHNKSLSQIGADAPRAR